MALILAIPPSAPGALYTGRSAAHVGINPGVPPVPEWGRKDDCALDSARPSSAGFRPSGVVRGGSAAAGGSSGDRRPARARPDCRGRVARGAVGTRLHRRPRTGVSRPDGGLLRLVLFHARAGTLELLRYPAFSVPTLAFPALFFLLFAAPRSQAD